VAKGLLPYRGLGSGIKRALEDWPEIDFVDDREGFLFTAKVHRKAETSSVKVVVPSASSGKTSGKILAALKQDENLTIPELASLMGVTLKIVYGVKLRKIL
jgi:ATP-dependent DNA helicase RecG